MLVLLVIFMITAPLLTAGVEVDLPKTKSTPLTGSDEPISVSVKGDGRIFIQETEIAVENLGPRLTAIGDANQDLRIFVRGDRGVPYGRVMQAVGAIHNAGFTRVALVTSPDETEASDEPSAEGNGTP
jgi:biopolymer transport protein TolR